jgi:hypothetical protein
LRTNSAPDSVTQGQCRQPAGHAGREATAGSEAEVIAGFQAQEVVLSSLVGAKGGVLPVLHASPRQGTGQDDVVK